MGIMTKLRAGGKNYWQQDFRSVLLPVAAEQLLEARVGSNHSGPLIRGGSSYCRWQIDQAQNSRVTASSIHFSVEPIARRWRRPPAVRRDP
jgi:hypothetical protein